MVTMKISGGWSVESENVFVGLLTDPSMQMLSGVPRIGGRQKTHGLCAPAHRRLVASASL